MANCTKCKKSVCGCELIGGKCAKCRQEEAEQRTKQEQAKLEAKRD